MKKIGTFANSGAILVGALMLSNVLNFVFSALMGRILSLEQFGILTVINSLYYLVSIFLNALGNTVNHWVAFLSNTKGRHAGDTFFMNLQKILFVIATVSTALWLLASPSLQSFFHLPTIYPILFFAPLVFAAPFLGGVKGYLQGTFLFFFAGITILSEVISKLLLTSVLLSGHTDLMYVTIPFSVCVSTIIGYVFMQKSKLTVTDQSYKFPRSFFLFSIVNAVISTAFLSIDVVLVKHFLSATEAGQYALLALTGKMVYFFGSLGNALLVTYISRDEAKQKNVQKPFFLFVTATAVLSAVMFFALGPLGPMTLPLLLGQKILPLLPYMTNYVLAIALFTVTNVIITFHITLHNYIFSVIAVLSTVGMMGGIFYIHANIGDIVNTLLMVTIVSLVSCFALHLLYASQKISAKKIYTTV